MATEMVLIPKSAYERWRSDQVIETAGDIDKKDEAKKSLNTDDTSGVKAPDPVSSNGRVKTSDVSGKDHKYADVADGEVKETLAPPLNGVKNDNTGENQDVLAMVEAFPKNYRLYAKRLLIYIKKSGAGILEWDGEKKVVVYRGKPVKGSDIIELINYIFKTSSPKPVGLDTFRKAMAEISVPKAYLKPYLLTPMGVSKKIKKKWAKY
jgi:hypothetical protein